MGRVSQEEPVCPCRTRRPTMSWPALSIRPSGTHWLFLIDSFPMSTFDAVAELPLEIEACELEGLGVNFGSFERLTTLIKLRGGGHEGIGEDVVYDALDHIALRDAGAPDGLAGRHTLASFSELLASVELF